MPTRTQTLLEERVNAFTHGLGVLFSFYCIYILWQKVLPTGDDTMLMGVTIFSIGMVAVYASSTIYHAIQHPPFKKIANIADHISIFILIGGTYAPIILHYVPESTALVFMIVQWLIILAGIVFKIFYTGKYEWLSVTLYVILGWMLLFVLKPIILTMPANIFFWIIAGGICYTSGIVFYLLDHRKHAHNIWHCFVLAGTLFHFIAVYKSIDVEVLF